MILNESMTSDLKLIGLLSLIGLLFGACINTDLDSTNPDEQNSSTSATIILENNKFPSKRQLQGVFFEKKEVLVVYDSENPEIIEKYETLSKTMKERRLTYYGGKIKFEFKKSDEVTEKELKEKILYLIGTSTSNPVLNDFSRASPFAFENNKISFNQKDFLNKSDILSVKFFPNPNDKTIPFCLLVGNDENEVFDFFTEIHHEDSYFFWQNMDFEIYRSKKRIALGNFDSTWELEKDVFFDFASNNDTIYSSTHFDFLSHQKALDSVAAEKLAIKIEESTVELLNFVGNKTIPRITYHIYKTAEDKGLILGNTHQAHSNFANNTVHTIINNKYKDNYIQKENELIIAHTIGEAKSKALEKGLAVFHTKQWQREGYKYWSARLAESNNALTLAELFDNELIEKESPLITACMSASLVDFLISEQSKATFISNYSNWIPSKKELKKLEGSWQKYLANEVKKNPKKIREKGKLNYLKGFNFAHEGYNIYNGYLSSKATESLQKQADLGGNAMAIVPYSYINTEAPPTYLSIGNRAGSENDEGIVHSAFEARKRGMETLLKPQIFFGNSWPGALEYKNEKDWDGFFEYYYRWIRHYAFLAEIHQIESFCMGVEFVIATLSHEKQWTKMIRGVRGLYQGKLTYAANWGDEFENVGFWNELDFIGLNSYYPLSKEDTPSDDDLRENFNEVKEKIQKVYDTYNKPIVFTEIGFRSIEMPWKNPHAGGRDQVFNEEDQQRCYEIIFEGIQNEPWCQGILWWKYPSYLEYRGIQNTSFTPNNKKADATVKEWFNK